MLAIEVEYLMGRVFAGDFRDRAEAEWPPHPSRLFSAMVSALNETQMGAAARRALEWLEREPPPQISAAMAARSEAVTSYVSVNYRGKNGNTLPALRDKQARQFPSRTPSHPAVHFIWPESAPDADMRAALAEITSRIGYLGKSSSMVRVALTDAPPAANYLADDAGSHALRVALPGRVAELERLYELNHWIPATAQQRYRRVDDEAPPLPGPARTVFGDMIVLRRSKGLQLTAEAALGISVALRAALMKLAGDDGEVPELLHGHGRHPHCAFAALPFTGTEYSDASLKGAAVIVPRSASAQDRLEIRALTARLEWIALPEGLGTWEVEPVEDSPLLRTLDAKHWTAKSAIWSSVTPVLLDRFPKPKGPSVAEILGESCVRVGLPFPVEITHGAYAQMRGVPPVPAFRLRRQSGERPRWGVHATLTFDQPVEGPVLIGAGRYFGLGLMRPAVGVAKNDHP